MVHEPLAEDDPTQRKPDITLANQRLGWRSAVDLRDGLKATIAYFRDKLGMGV